MDSMSPVSWDPTPPTEAGKRSSRGSRIRSKMASMVYDGRTVRVPDYPQGYFLAPTILEDVNVDMSMAKEETFGAVAALIRCENLNQAIEWINTKTNLGHSAAIMTQSCKYARKFIREANVGNVAVNLGVAQPYVFSLWDPEGNRLWERPSQESPP